ncbi:MAG: DUF393 domain-containing protein [Deinococcota bacterium]
MTDITANVTSTSMSSDKTSVLPKTLVLYDGDCGFCQWSVNLALKFDRHTRLEPRPLQTPGLLEQHNISRQAAETALHVVTPSGQVVQAGYAIKAILHELPLWRGAQVWWFIPGFGILANWVYARVAANRHKLGQLLLRVGISEAQCQVSYK